MKLNENFNQQEFIDWISGFLPDFSKDIRKVDVSKSFQGIKSIQTIGESSLGVRVYIIETEQDPSRRKIGLATESFTLLRDYGTPNAIIVYYSENSSLWRLSLLTSTLTWDEGKIKKKLSNPKRQSYVLGSKAKVKTPHQYLISKGSVTDFADLKSRFSLEVVNKEFYKEISSAFIHLVGGQIANGKSKKTVEAQLKLPFVKDHSQTSQEFAVRLIGRIIFCWFLREKRSASGHSLMPRELLSFEASSNIEDYYHKILEPIFFEVLNKPIKTRKDAFINDLFSAIPYLNGGLFSPHEDDYFNYNEGKQAVNHNMVVVPDGWLKSLFEVLETFNFTIDENTSFDEELSIDPEMLGRIFENLLAEINPETGESARKSTGSYYTPRVIVDYMVDESLYLFLKEKTNILEEKLRSLISYDLEDDNSSPLNDEEKDKIAQALGSIKILDPACGSGAFPIGALQKIVFILQQIDQHGQLWFKKQIQNTPIELRKVIEREFQEKNFDYIRKLGIIRENIYGIDIQPIATEISRLRCFLTLVVDERIDDTLENRGIEPLPNLDFKFVTANTLVGLPTTVGKASQVGLFEDNEGINELKEVRDMFFNASGFERDQLKLQFVQTQNKMFQKLINEGLRGHADMTAKLTTWDPFSHKSASWFDPEWMFGIDSGFDVIIGNPPYIQLQSNKGYLANIYQDLAYETFVRTGDIYTLFYERGLKFSKSGSGILCFITSNKWIKASYGEKLRSFLLRYSPSILIDLGAEIFENVSVHTNILIVRNEQNKKVGLRAISLTNEHVQNISRSLSEDGVILSNLTSSTWLIGSDLELEIQQKLQLTGILLKNSGAKIYRGLLTGLNEAFIIDEETRLKLINEDIRNSEIIKPILRGKDIKRYTFDDSKLYILATGYDLDVPNTYPSIYNHLLQYKDKAMKRDDQGKNWWNLRACVYYDEFEKNKLAWGNLAIRSSVSLIPSGFYINAPTNMLTVTDDKKLYFLLAYLNSTISNYQLNKLTYSREGGYREYKKVFIEQLLLPRNLNDSNIYPISTLARKIFEQKRENPLYNSDDEENEIDSLIFKLFNLSDKEKEIIKKYA